MCTRGDEIVYLIGWNSWNHFACGINEKLIQKTADIIVSSGLAAAGYEYGLLYVFDDCISMSSM